MNKKILIVEDNELNMKLFNDVLLNHGYETIQVRRGNDALPLTQDHHPDLILLDIQLPEISGLEISRRLKESVTLRHIPIIAVTAFTMRGDEERIRASGCEAYLSKPISVQNLLHKVAELISS